MYFFFQAEDGIRDWSVTGVQTCALPIYIWVPLALDPQKLQRAAYERHAVVSEGPAPAGPKYRLGRAPGNLPPCSRTENQIGRASCRERVMRAMAERGSEWKSR